MSGQLAAVGGDCLDMGKLPQADGSGDVGHVELAPQYIHIQTVEAVAGDPLQAVLLGQAHFFRGIEYQAAALGQAVQGIGVGKRFGIAAKHNVDMA